MIKVLIIKFPREMSSIIYLSCITSWGMQEITFCMQGFNMHVSRRMQQDKTEKIVMKWTAFGVGIIRELVPLRQILERNQMKDCLWFFCTRTTASFLD